MNPLFGMVRVHLFCKRQEIFHYSASFGIEGCIKLALQFFGDGILRQINWWVRKIWLSDYLLELFHFHSEERFIFDPGEATAVTGATLWVHICFWCGRNTLLYKFFHAFRSHQLSLSCWVQMWPVHRKFEANLQCFSSIAILFCICTDGIWIKCEKRNGSSHLKAWKNVLLRVSRHPVCYYLRLFLDDLLWRCSYFLNFLLNMYLLENGYISSFYQNLCII